MYKPIYILEYDNAKDQERFEKYIEFIREEWLPYVNKLQEDGVCKRSAFADNTGHIIGIYEFDDLEAFSKVWNDDKWQQLMIRYGQMVDNARTRLCRPSMIIGTS